MKDWYDMESDKRNVCGMKGHEFVNDKEIMMSSEAMCQNFMNHMDTAFEKFKPRKPFSIFKA